MKELLIKIYRYFVDTARGELIVSLLIMFLLAIIFIILGHSVKKLDPTKPNNSKLALIAEMAVSYADKKVTDILGNAYLKFAPYYLFLVVYIVLAFIAGLFGLASPMTYYTIPLCLAFGTWISIQISAIKYQKIEYLKGFTSPLPTWMPVFVPINILSKISPLMSLSIRMFGNALSGSILMFLIYWGTGKASSLFMGLIGLGDFNILGMIIAPVFHAYFDAFGSFIQMTIFTTLTLLLIGAEIPAPVNIDENLLYEKERKREERRALRKASKSIR